MAWKSGQSYSSDLRSRVLAAIDGGGAAKAVARQFQVSISYVYKALGRREATGETEADRSATSRRSSSKNIMLPSPPRSHAGRT